MAGNSTNHIKGLFGGVNISNYIIAYTSKRAENFCPFKIIVEVKVKV